MNNIYKEFFMRTPTPYRYLIQSNESIKLTVKHKLINNTEIT